MFWRHRVNMRDLLGSLEKKSESDLQKELPVLRAAIAERLEEASVFRSTNFPERFRKQVNSVEDFNSTLDELYDFSMEQKVWLGL